MSDVTSRDIMKATGIVNVATLIRWHQMGLIPEPEIRAHPNGRGKMAYWPAWVLPHCVRIKQLRKSGLKLSEILSILGRINGSDSPSHRQRYRFSEVSLSMDKNAAFMNLREFVEDHLVQWAESQRRISLKSNAREFASDIIEKGIEFLEAGINVVLVLSSRSAFLTSDFAVGLYLSQCTSSDDSILVIPLWTQLRAFAHQLGQFPVSPTVFPVARVCRDTENSTEELEVVLLDGMDFEIQAPKRRRRSKKEGQGNPEQK